MVCSAAWLHFRIWLHHSLQSICVCVVPQGIVAQQTQEVDNAETAAAVAIEDREAAEKKLANAERTLEDARGKQQHSLQVTASPTALPEVSPFIVLVVLPLVMALQGSCRVSAALVTSARSMHLNMLMQLRLLITQSHASFCCTRWSCTLAVHFRQHWNPALRTISQILYADQG